MGNAVVSDAQQMKPMPGLNSVVEPLKGKSTTLKKFVQVSPDESTPIAPISKKEIKNVSKKNKNGTMLGGDKKITATLPGLKIGYTYYDFQTNNSMPERIAYFDDGTNKFTQMFWMAAKDSSKGTSNGQLDAPGFNSSRGAHYAFIDVTNPDAPVNQYDTWEKMEAEKVSGQPERRGWPSIVQFKDGSVGTPSHTPVDFFKTSDYGDNTFTRTTVDNTTSTWPRAAVDGQDIVHVIYNTNVNSTTTNDQTLNLLCYRRSTDKGKTWEAEKVFTNKDAFDANGAVFPYGAGGDSYAIAARGNNVVVLYGQFPNSDAFYRKSTDNGKTWSLPFYAYRANYSNIDTSFYDADSARIRTDTVPACGNQFDVVLDSEGNAHFVFNLVRSFKEMTGTHSTINGKDSVRVGLNLFGNSDALSEYQSANLGFAYHKEGDQFVYYIARPSSLNWDGNGVVVSRRAASGLCRYPQLGLDENDNIYLCFTSIKNADTKTVGIDTTTTAPTTGRDGIADVDVQGLLGHIYVTHRLKGDANPNWSEPKDITPEGVDCLFGTLCNKVMNGRMYIGYSADATPGDRVTNTELPTEQTEIYIYPFPTTSLNTIPPVGVEEEAASNDGLALTSQPNPTSGVTAFAFTAPQTGNATVTITNALGMNVATLYNGLLTAGTTQSVNFDAQNLASGAYYATLEINGRKVTKMITIVK